MPATAFITAEEALKFSDPENSNTLTVDQQALYAANVDAVCEAMEEYLRRPIVAQELTAESDGGAGKVFLKHHGSKGILRITKITEKGAVLFEAAGGALDDSTLSGPYHEVYKGEGYIARIAVGNFSAWAAGPKAVKVTYTAGVAKDVPSVPANLRLCAKIAFKFFRRMGDQDFGKVVEGGSFITPDQFPKQCLWMMKPYRLPGGAG